MLPFLSNAFNDPSNPWYYVIGVLFLLLIFGALVAYMLFSKKKKDGSEKSEAKDADELEPNCNASKDADVQESNSDEKEKK